MYISKWEVVLSAPDRVNLPCLVYDTRLYKQKFYDLVSRFILVKESFELHNTT